MIDRQKIIVSVIDGRVKHVEGIPNGIEVVVRHYDTTGVEDYNVYLDEYGDEFWEGCWRPTE